MVIDYTVLEPQGDVFLLVSGLSLWLIRDANYLVSRVIPLDLTLLSPWHGMWWMLRVVWSIECVLIITLSLTVSSIRESLEFLLDGDVNKKMMKMLLSQGKMNSLCYQSCCR